MGAYPGVDIISERPGSGVREKIYGDSFRLFLLAGCLAQAAGRRMRPSDGLVILVDEGPRWSAAGLPRFRGLISFLVIFRD